MRKVHKKLFKEDESSERVYTIAVEGAKEGLRGKRRRIVQVICLKIMITVERIAILSIVFLDSYIL